jgi:hypothetical protein
MRRCDLGREYLVLHRLWVVPVSPWIWTAQHGSRDRIEHNSEMDIPPWHIYKWVPSFIRICSTWSIISNICTAARTVESSPKSWLGLGEWCSRSSTFRHHRAQGRTAHPILQRDLRRCSRCMCPSTTRPHLWFCTARRNLSHPRWLHYQMETEYAEAPLQCAIHPGVPQILLQLGLLWWVLCDSSGSLVSSLTWNLVVQMEFIADLCWVGNHLPAVEFCCCAV